MNPEPDRSTAESTPQWEHIRRNDDERVRAFAHEGGVSAADPSQTHGDQPASESLYDRAKWPLIFFLATCVSTYYVGGLAYATAIITILLCHEFGHFLQAVRYRVPASLPYFIPMPFTPLGTMGVVISMKGRIPNRKALFDIGISGPLAGLVPALICTVVGLKLSTVEPIPDGKYFVFGDPLIFKWIGSWFFEKPDPGHDIFLHPIALAGWTGIFVTALNLIPIGQLDGGHILYAMLRQWSYPITTLLLYGAMAAMVLTRHYDWLLLILLLLLSGPNHPPTRNDAEPLGDGRVLLGWLTLAFIFIGFTPVPLKVVS